MTNPTAKPPSRIHQALRLRALVLLAIVLNTAVAMAVARLHWAAELFTHFVAFYFLGACLATLMLLWMRERRWGGLTAAIALVYGVLLLPYIPIRWNDSSETRNLRIMSANVLTENHDYNRFLDSVRRVNPDIIAMQEVNESWVKQLVALESEYPYSKKSPRSDSFGIALYSRLPFEHLAIDYIQPYNLDSITASLRINETIVHLRVAHTLPPGNRDYASGRNAQLAFIAAWARERTSCIVVGDLNTTMWSPYYRDFIRQSRLINTRNGRGILGTWPSWLGPLALPLDHILVSESIGTISCAHAPRTGSDHVPLVADLRVKLQ